MPLCLATILRDSTVVVVVVVVVVVAAAAVITMRKSTHGFPFVSHIWVAYGAPLLKQCSLNLAPEMYNSHAAGPVLIKIKIPRF